MVVQCMCFVMKTLLPYVGALYILVLLINRTQSDVYPTTRFGSRSTVLVPLPRKSIVCIAVHWIVDGRAEPVSVTINTNRCSNNKPDCSIDGSTTTHECNRVDPNGVDFIQKEQTITTDDAMAARITDDENDGKNILKTAIQNKEDLKKVCLN